MCKNFLTLQLSSRPHHGGVRPPDPARGARGAASADSRRGLRRTGGYYNFDDLHIDTCFLFTEQEGAVDGDAVDRQEYAVEQGERPHQGSTDHSAELGARSPSRATSSTTWRWAAMAPAAKSAASRE
jgi:hypothetical protein